MDPIKVIVADTNYLIRKGLQQLIASENKFCFVDEVCSWDELVDQVKKKSPHVVVMDYTTIVSKVEEIQRFLLKFPSVKILAITDPQPRFALSKALDAGITSYLLKECDKEEIIEALIKTAKGEQFLCGKIVEVLMTDSRDSSALQGSIAACDGVVISDREMEIIKLVAEGYSNKQIAEKLFLSTHTVTTHRKNIMNKLNLANTAALVLYAVRQNLVHPNHFLFS